MADSMASLMALADSEAAATTVDPSALSSTSDLLFLLRATGFEVRDEQFYPYFLFLLNLIVNMLIS